MQILDWLRDGFFNNRTRYRRTDGVRPAKAEEEEREDPSGHYEFGSDPAHRMIRPHTKNT